jgi:type I restriction enzyme, S subunit
MFLYELSLANSRPNMSASTAVSFCHLPDTWHVHKVGELCKVGTGGTPSTKVPEYYDPPAVNWIKSGDVKGLYIDLAENRISETGMANSAATPHPPGTVLMAMSGRGKTRATTAILRIEAACSQSVAAITPTKQISSEFLHFQFVQRYSEIRGITGSDDRSGLNMSLIRDIDLMVPPIHEQRNIAYVLTLAQRAIAQQEGLLKITSELKKVLLHQLFTEGLRRGKQKETEIGLIPESWDVVPLGSLAKVGNGSTPKRDNEGYWHGGTIPWLNSAKIHERFISKADQFVTDLAMKECHLPRVGAGSLLIAITGQGKTLGNSALVSFETCINQHLAYAQFKSPRVVPEFVLWFMQTRYEHLRSISQAGGSTKGALTCGYLKTYPVPVPSLDEQREIANIFAALDQKEKVHERKMMSLADLLRALLHQLMTAQIRVHDLDILDLEAAAAK